MTIKQNIKDFSWPRLLGFIQSDGHIRFELSDHTFNPRIFITVTEKRRVLINRIVAFLEQEGLVVRDEPKRKDDGWTEHKPWVQGTNILIERQKNVLLFLDKVRPLEESISTPVSLFDYKKRDLELLKEALKINDQKKSSKVLEEKLQCNYKILDIKEAMFKFHTGKRKKTPKQFAAMLGVTDLTLVNGAASSIVIACEQKTRDFQRKLLQASEKWGTIDDVTSEVGDFLAGVFEGDGCFSLKIDCQDPTKNSTYKRPYVNISSLLTLSNQKKGLEKTDPVFLLANNVFRKGKSLTIHDKTKNANAVEWTCADPDDIEQRVIPFFNKYGFCSEHSLARFELMAKFASQREIILKDEGKFKSFVQEIYEHPNFYHERPIDEVFELASRHFEFERNQIK